MMRPYSNTKVVPQNKSPLVTYMSFVALDSFRSGNNRGLLFDKNSNYLAFFPTQVWTFFLTFTPCYIHYFWDLCPIWYFSAASFFPVKDILIEM